MAQRPREVRMLWASEPAFWQVAQVKLLLNSLLFIALHFTATLYAQQAISLTPAQAAAIQAEETRWNTHDLGNFGYGQIIYNVDSVTTAKKGRFTPDPKPGTIAVAVVEHLTGGKSPQPGYTPTVYWLEPQGGDTWKAGFPAYVDRSDIMPTEAAAIAILHGKPIPSTVKQGLNAQGIMLLIFVVALLIAVFGGLIWYVVRATRPKVVGRVTCVNPSCRQPVEPPQGTPCANCTSHATQILKMPVGGGYDPVTRRHSKGAYDIVRYCFNCKSKMEFRTQCPHCGTDLRRIMLDRTS